jgi:uncharacterized protein YecT (DUF1311 family)
MKTDSIKHVFTAGLIALFAAALPSRVCASDAAAADAALNTNYKALMSQLGSADQSRLRDAQRAWVAFRDKECAFKAQGRNDAALAKSVNEACVAGLTQQRADGLKRELDCPASDATCVPRAQASASAPAGTCSAAVGAAKAEEYVAQCQQVSPATHPPCNVANPCELIVDEIKRGCAFIGKDAPKFCAEYAQ